MDVSLDTLAEQNAQQALDQPAFGQANLPHIKRQVALLLEQIGRNRIFDEYTIHNIRHADAMLKMLPWIIPASTQQAMSPADWLMTVLAIYFHDLGMLVTKEEFNNRQHSDFPTFKHQIMTSTDTEDTDYRARVRVLDDDEAELFLYQEFIRKYHAKRIRTWVIGQEDPTYGVSTDAAREVAALLDPLGPLFRDDLVS